MARTLTLSLVVAMVLLAGIVPTAAMAASADHGVDGVETPTVAMADSAQDLVQLIQQSATTLSPGVLFTAGLHRHDDEEDDDVLDNDVRARLYDAISASPGTYVAALAERTAIPRSTIRYHVRVLEREELVFGEKIRGKQRYFTDDDDHPVVSAALEDEAVASVLAAISRLEPASTTALAAELDRAPSTVSHHVSRLADDGLVERERDGTTVLTSLRPEVRPAFE